MKENESIVNDNPQGASTDATGHEPVLTQKPIPATSTKLKEEQPSASSIQTREAKAQSTRTAEKEHSKPSVDSDNGSSDMAIAEKCFYDGDDNKALMYAKRAMQSAGNKDKKKAEELIKQIKYRIGESQ